MSPRAAGAMKVVTANVLHGRDPGDGVVDLDRYAAGLAALDADVLALQEVDLHQPRSHRSDLAAVAARACGLPHWRFLPQYTGLRGAAWARADGSADLARRLARAPGTAAYGIALLSRHPVTAWRELRLPWLRPAPLARVLGAAHGDEPRVALAARVEGPSGPVTVVATHLSHLSPWPAVQLLALRRRVLRPRAGDDGAQPLLLMGDLNLPGALPARLTGLSPLASAATFPVGAPDRQIDHLLGRGLTATAAGAVRMPFSDHRALVAEVAPAPRRPPLLSPPRRR